MGLADIATLSPIEAERIVKQNRGRDICLGGLLRLGAGAAAVLARHDKGLSFPALTDISAEAAEAISLHRGSLRFGCVALLSEVVADALSRHQGPELVFGAGIDLGDSMQMSAEAANRLSAYRGLRLTLNALRSLSDDVALALSQYKGSLDLNRVKTLSDEAARALAHHKGRQLSLDGLDTLSDSAASALAAYDGWLSLRGVRNISSASAEPLRANPDVEIPGGHETQYCPNEARVLVSASKFLLHSFFDILSLPLILYGFWVQLLDPTAVAVILLPRNAWLPLYALVWMIVTAALLFWAYTCTLSLCERFEAAFYVSRRVRSREP